jgi:hypothetical protein
MGELARKRPANSEVRRRNVRKPLETCGDLLDAYAENPPAHQANLKVLKLIERERGRRSARRK